MPADWKGESSTALTSVSALVTAATATGDAGVAKAGSGVTYIIVNNFHFVESPDAVSAQSFDELRAKVAELQSQLQAKPDERSRAQRCMEEFQGNWEKATTKR